MQDRQVFEQILGIVSPWFVADVELALSEGEVEKGAVFISRCSLSLPPSAG
jgi:hypothetical protein